MEDVYDDDFVVCPYCGYQHSDPHEYFDTREDTEIECSECGKEFAVTRIVSETYRSSVIPPKQPR